MTDTLPEDSTVPDDDDLLQPDPSFENDKFAASCLRWVLIYLAVYVIIGIASTVFGFIWDSPFLPVVGWAWPLAVTIILLGVGAVG